MKISYENMEKEDAEENLELGCIRKKVLRLLNTKYFNSEDIAVLNNVVLVRVTNTIYQIANNSTLSILLHNKRLENDLKIEITLSMLNKDKEKLERLGETMREIPWNNYTKG